MSGVGGAALVVLLSGPPGAGKARSRDVWLRGSNGACTLKVDDLRDIVVNGFEPPGDEWTPGHERQFARARAAATSLRAGSTPLTASRW